MSHEDSNELLTLIFECINKHVSHEPLHVKSDLAMDVYGIFYQWANPQVDINEGEVEIHVIHYSPKPLEPGGPYDAVN